MKSEDKIIKALNVLDEMCEREKSLVNKFIVSDMSKSLRSSFQCTQHTLDAQSNHTEEKDKRIQELETALLDCLEHERPCSDTMDKYRAIAEK